MNMKIRIHDHVYSVKVGNLKSRPVLVEVEGETFEVWPEQDLTDRGSRRIDDLQVTSPSSTSLPQPNIKITRAESSAAHLGDPEDPENYRLRSIRAPIPGIITAIYVASGSEVEVGQELLKLEAMKMNNSIRANRSGTIRAVHISVGQTVKLNQVLLEFA